MLPTIFGNRILNAEDYRLISEEIEALRKEAIVGASSDFEIKPLSSGRYIALAPSQHIDQIVTAGSVADESGIVLEMHYEWDGSIQYLQDERVVYKPEGSEYYYIYSCTDTSAGEADRPDISIKWDCQTHYDVLWQDATGYQAGATVMHGTPWQMRRYTANAGTAPGEEPGSSDKWDYMYDVIFGIPAWPAGDNGEYKVPFASYEVSSVRYSEISHQLAYYHRKSTYNIDGSLRKVDASNYVTYATAVPHPM